MDRPTKRADTRASVIPPGPEPTWTLDEPALPGMEEWRGGFVQEQLDAWVNSLEALLRGQLITRDEMLSAVREFMDKHHLWSANLRSHGADRPEHSLWTAETDEFAVTNVRALLGYQPPSRVKEHHDKWGNAALYYAEGTLTNHFAGTEQQQYFQSRRIRQPRLWSGLESTWAERERQYSNVTAREAWHPEQHHMFIHYPAGGNPFHRREPNGTPLERAKGGISNEHIDIGSGVRKLL